MTPAPIGTQHWGCLLPWGASREAQGPEPGQKDQNRLGRAGERRCLRTGGWDGSEGFPQANLGQGGAVLTWAQPGDPWRRALGGNLCVYDLKRLRSDFGEVMQLWRQGRCRSGEFLGIGMTGQVWCLVWEREESFQLGFCVPQTSLPTSLAAVPREGSVCSPACLGLRGRAPT